MTTHPTCLACPDPPAIGPWCVRHCSTSRKAVVAVVGLPPAPQMPAPGRYRGRLRIRQTIPAVEAA